ncbi:cation diffusion zinc membrane transporter Zrg17 [Sporothrix epigloea]|uniref:Zinc transporter n=1 Tax=Sporothrix epigloea TaxID=1892477 RepID=A0ABP0DW82_9PEZI
MASIPKLQCASPSITPVLDSPAARATHRPRLRPPSILLEPTSDEEGDGSSINAISIHGDGIDDPFPFELADNSSELYNGQPLNTHAAALLRRSPSPGRDFTSPLPASASRIINSSPSTHLLSPESNVFSNRGVLRPASAMDDSFSAPATSPSNSPAYSPADSAPISIAGSSSAGNPFNFQTQYISTSPVKSNIGLRRGHRYKHSSVSAQHQIFQEPPARPPPVLPASLPVPTLREAWISMQRDQRVRFYWCLCHAAVAVFVFLCAAEGGDSLALTALSHLVFFDVGSAAVCVAVDVLGNFEVWRRSTIRHPFGLRRAEVLAGFAMSIFLVFGGFDLLSHDLKDCLEAATSETVSQGAAHAGHAHTLETSVDAAGYSMAAAVASGTLPHMAIGSHSGHHHSRYIHPGTVDVAALAAFASTLVSAYGLGNDARIRRALLMLHGVTPYSRSSSGGFVKSFFAWLSSAAGFLSSLGLSSLLANPFHILTLTVSLVLLVLPLMFVAVQTWLDRLLCATIALSMLLLGSRLAVAQGLMLLMSFSGKEGGVSGPAGVSSPKSRQSRQNQQPLQQHLPSSSTSTSVVPEKSAATVASVLDEIASEPQIARIEDAQFWQVHYGLGMANLRIRVAQGCNDDNTLRQVRSRISRVVQSRLGEGYGKGNSLRWEVTVQTSVDG